MAKLISPLQFTGSLAGLSFYQLAGSEDIIVRKKGGPTKKQVQSSAAMKNTRLRNMEFGGRAMAAGHMMAAMQPFRTMGGYRLAGRLNKVLYQVQLCDTASALGTRSIAISSHPELAEGFNINPHNGWEEIINQQPELQFSPANRSASLYLPALVRGLHFNPPAAGGPVFRLQFTVARIPDLLFNGAFYAPKQYQAQLQLVESSWMPVTGGFPATTLASAEGALPVASSGESLLFCAGICFGTPGPGGSVQVRAHTGAGKIVAIKTSPGEM